MSTSHTGLFADYPRVPLPTNPLQLQASRGPLPGGALEHSTVSFSSPTRVPLSGKSYLASVSEEKANLRINPLDRDALLQEDSSKNRAR